MLYDELAPEISVFVNETVAKDFAENLLEVSVVVYKELSDLSVPERSALFQWLKWFGVNNRPSGLSDYTKFSLSQVAARLNMKKSYLQALIAERNAIINEVRTFGEEAFTVHEE